MSTIYLDNAATTKVRDEIVDTMSTIIKNEYGKIMKPDTYFKPNQKLFLLLEAQKEIT